MYNGYFAALLRGLCIDLTGKPCVILTEADKRDLPAAAMRVEIDSGVCEENAAEIIRKTYDHWEKTASHCSCCQHGGILLPSCIALCVNNAVEAVFWRGNDLDSAGKRLADNDAAPVEESVAKGKIMDCAAANKAIVDPEERATVFKNKIALVTGGAQGIGEEIVLNLAAAGALVFIADLNIEGARELAKEINAAHGKTAVIALKVNVFDEESVKEMINTVAEIAGGLDLCVSNAGVLKAGNVLELELDDFKFITDVNYTGFFVVSKYVGRLMRAQHLTALNWKTDIVQINSKSGLVGSIKNSAYSGSKFGGIGLVTSYAKELVDYNIKVNAICPGNFLDGPLWSNPENGLLVQYLKAGKVPGAKSVADVRAFYEAKVPMKRGCTGKDVMRALYYIVEQEYETGQAIPVTGGQVMLY